MAAIPPAIIQAVELGAIAGMVALVDRVAIQGRPGLAGLAEEGAAQKRMVSFFAAVLRLHTHLVAQEVVAGSEFWVRAAVVREVLLETALVVVAVVVVVAAEGLTVLLEGPATIHRQSGLAEVVVIMAGVVRGSKAPMALVTGALELPLVAQSA